MRRCDWSTAAGYAQFLEIQYAARLPIERWAKDHCPVQFTPPAQSELIANDLVHLGRAVPKVATSFAIPADANPIGLAWALAGSSQGNRMILREIESAGESKWSAEFLSDPQMIAFWKELRPQIERPTTQGESWAASIAALAVFAHFSRCANLSIDEMAA